MPTYYKRNLWVLIAVFAILSAFNGVKKKTLRVVFIGDSITYGAAVQDKAHQAPPAVAATELGQMALIKAVDFYNAGRSGATTLDFLPGTANFKNVADAADAYYKEQTSLTASEQSATLLLFSIMLGTNDSAIEGTNGAPVSPDQYQQNLTIIIDGLLRRYPGSKIVIQEAPWYSDNTQNGAKYLKEGRARLESYNPKIEALVKQYKKTMPGRVFLGDKSAYSYFKKNYTTKLSPENGRQGIFYLHPNTDGSAVLGKKWAKAIYKAAMKDAL